MKIETVVKGRFTCYYCKPSGNGRIFRYTPHIATYKLLRMLASGVIVVFPQTPMRLLTQLSG